MSLEEKENNLDILAGPKGREKLRRENKSPKVKEMIKKLEVKPTAAPVAKNLDDRDFLRDSEGRISIFRPSSWYAKTNKEKKEDTLVKRGRDPKKQKLIDQFEGAMKGKKRRKKTSYEEPPYECIDNSTVKVPSKRSESSTASTGSVLEALGNWLSSLFDKIKEFSNALGEKFNYALDTMAPKMERNQLGNQSSPSDEIVSTYAHHTLKLEPILQQQEKNIAQENSTSLEDSYRGLWNCDNSKKVKFATTKKAPVNALPGNGGQFGYHRGRKLV